MHITEKDFELTSVLLFCWLLPLLVKIDAAIFDGNITNHSQYIKSQFQ